eukprot:TRINITY_DN74341_c0_g1_i1.p1 TRINITY_DN74341_c0_g1~~TRINITY_DN74341_c0_g1_i1.p1  ORF type:complete len:289 (+),score=35.64 TRINITY_DN74341_c0_g1_i1:76-867(+)
MAPFLYNFAMLQTEADKLRDYLFLGAAGAAHNLDGLRKLGVTHVLNVADDVAEAHPQAFQCLRLMIKDGGQDATIVESFDSATAFVHQAIKCGGKVLMHCLFGVNRSATIALAVLMNIEGWQLSEAYDHIVERRPKVSLKQGNKEKIAMWELRTRGASTMLGWLPLEARIAELQRQLEAPAPPEAIESTQLADCLSSSFVRHGARFLRNLGEFCRCFVCVAWLPVIGPLVCNKKRLIDADNGQFGVPEECATLEPSSKRQRRQ